MSTTTKWTEDEQKVVLEIDDEDLTRQPGEERFATKTSAWANKYREVKENAEFRFSLVASMRAVEWLPVLRFVLCVNALVFYFYFGRRTDVIIIALTLIWLELVIQKRRRDV